MKILLTIIKLVLATFASRFLLDDDVSILYTVVVYAFCYGMISYYLYYLKDGLTNGFFGDGMWDFSLLGVIVGFFLKLFAPIIVLLIFAWILQKIFGEDLGMNIAMGIVLVVSFGCLIADIVGIIQIFKPNFLSSGDNASSGYIKDDNE